MRIKIVDEWLDFYNIEPREYEHAGSNYEIDFNMIEKDIIDYCAEEEIEGKLKIDNDYSNRLYRSHVIDGDKYYEFIRDYSVGKEKFLVVGYEERN